LSALVPLGKCLVNRCILPRTTQSINCKSNIRYSASWAIKSNPRINLINYVYYHGISACYLTMIR